MNVFAIPEDTRSWLRFTKGQQRKFKFRLAMRSTSIIWGVFLVFLRFYRPFEDENPLVRRFFIYKLGLYLDEKIFVNKMKNIG